MESKYYIPDITEFREGFEYELKMDGNWYPMSSPFYPLVNNSGLEYRVKYLNKDDIENLGFEKSPDEPEEWFWNYKGDFNIQLYFNDKIENLDRGIGISMYNDSLVFSGYIKNKSELQQVLKMVGVI